MTDLHCHSDLEAQHFFGVEEAPTYGEQTVPEVHHQDLLFGSQLWVDTHDMFREDISTFQNVAFNPPNDSYTVLRRTENLVQRPPPVDCES